ncbi:hypothetical protein V1478_012383 [Vespula squamosa]|uniref:Uncharacterized protein n=1 Tax=Vespula squamosa TaxID=30214 RepID=A0ABD2ADV9_VESSQ
MEISQFEEEMIAMISLVTWPSGRVIRTIGLKTHACLFMDCFKKNDFSLCIFVDQTKLFCKPLHRIVSSRHSMRYDIWKSIRTSLLLSDLTSFHLLLLINMKYLIGWKSDVIEKENIRFNALTLN